MLKSEKKSLIRFLLIYLLSTFFLFALAGIIFYNYEKNHLLDKQRDMLSHKAEKIKTQIRTLHNTFDTVLEYPVHAQLKSAIYDIDKRYIMGTFKKKKSIGNEKSYTHGNQLFHIASVEPYYLGAAYLLVTQEIDERPMQNLKKSIYLYMFISGLFFAVLGIFLGRLFIAPMKVSIETMNRFIEDTTHELNTPIGTILANIEILDSSEKYHGSKELTRIEIASKTLSRIYDDLTYLTFNHKYNRNIMHVNASEVLYQRIDYFSGMAEMKGLSVESKIENNIYLDIDNNDLIRLIDNLISNAIKYNQFGGNIAISLSDVSFKISDTGVGISEKDIELILQRFKRVNQNEGGFGVGLDIVHHIVTYYGYRLKITSKYEEGTTMEIRWQN